MTNKKNHKSMIKERNPSSKKRVQKLKKSRIKKSHRRENKKQLELCNLSILTRL